MCSAAGAVYSLFRRKMPKDFQRMSLLQFSLMAFLLADHDRAAAEDGSAPAVAHQVRVDYTVVQHMKRRDCIVILSGAGVREANSGAVEGSLPKHTQ